MSLCAGQGCERSSIVLASPFVASQFRGPNWEPRHLCIESVSTASIRLSTGSLTDRLGSLFHFIPFLHIIYKLSTRELKEGPRQKLLPPPFYLVHKFPPPKRIPH